MLYPIIEPSAWASSIAGRWETGDMAGQPLFLGCAGSSGGNNQEQLLGEENRDERTERRSGDDRAEMVFNCSYLGSWQVSCRFGKEGEGGRVTRPLQGASGN